jgi:hypothetical protein
MAGEAETGGAKTPGARRPGRRWLDAWERRLGPFNRVVALALVLVVAASLVFFVKDGFARLGAPDPRAVGRAVKDSPLWAATRDDLRARVTGGEAAQSATTLRVPATFLVAYEAEIVAVDRRAGGVGQAFLLLVERDAEAPIEYHLKRAAASWRRAELGAGVVAALALVVFLAVVGWPPREDAVPTAQEPEALLLEDLRRTASRAAFFESRALALLVVGIAAAICGVAGAVYLALRLPPPAAAADTVDLVSKLGPVGMLIFVEAVAWFLLRQYRAHVDDFKTTHCIGARRLDFLMALRLLRSRDAEQVKPLVEALLRESPCPGESRGASAPAADESTVEKLVAAALRKFGA